mgnify:CR=1 FL=1
MKNWFCVVCVLFIIFTGCIKSKSIITTLEVTDIAVLSGDTYILSMKLEKEGYGASVLYSPGFDGYPEYEYFLASQTGTGADYRTIKEIEGISGVIVKENVIGHKGYYEGKEGIVFINASDYQVIKFIENPGLVPPDYTNDYMRFLLKGYAVYEQHTDTKIITTLTDTNLNVIDAKYNPLDQEEIAYIDSNSDGLYLIRNDGTGNTLLVSGLNAKRLYWNPDGNTIAFMSPDTIYTIERTGANLTVKRTFPEPSGYKAMCFYHDRVVYAMQDGLRVFKF